MEEAKEVVQIVPPGSIMHIPAEDSVLEASSPSNMNEVRPGLRAATLTSLLPQATVLHLACHGVQSPSSPLDGAFLLKDRPLPIAEIMQMRLPNAFLAYLSACETAKGDEQHPDQTIHLAAAMLFAGFKSVVATLWYVPVAVMLCYF
jgi:hypothetical protein